MMSCSNPTLWKFIDCLRAEQALTDARHTKRFLRERPEPRAPKWVRYDQNLQRIVDAYDDYSDKMDYLKLKSHRKQNDGDLIYSILCCNEICY